MVTDQTCHECGFSSILWLPPDDDGRHDKTQRNQSGDQNHPPFPYQISCYTLSYDHAQGDRKHNWKTQNTRAFRC